MPKATLQRIREQHQQLAALRSRRELIDQAITALEEAQRFDCEHLTRLISQSLDRSGLHIAARGAA